LTRKIHAVVDDNGLPLRLALSSGGPTTFDLPGAGQSDAPVGHAGKNPVNQHAQKYSCFQKFGFGV
jgi:hypothetical protein